MNADALAWITAWPEVAPAFTLAKLGYDVWLGNNRGNAYSIEHKTLNITDPEFWYFTWEEMGTLDLPAMIDFVVDET